MPAKDNELAINSHCPWSGLPVAKDSLTRYRGHTVGFCNPGCRDKFEKAVSAFEDAIALQTSKPDATQQDGRGPS